MLATDGPENGGRYRPWIKSIVDFCTDHPWLVLVTSLVLAAVSGFYAERNFAINTDIWKLISPELPWRQRQLAFDRTFPQRLESIIAVVDAEGRPLNGANLDITEKAQPPPANAFWSVTMCDEDGR